jgi:hypothetical protein
MPLKPSLVSNHDVYLGAKQLQHTHLVIGIWAWGVSLSKYIAQAFKNCKKHLIDKLFD